MHLPFKLTKRFKHVLIFAIAILGLMLVAAICISVYIVARLEPQIAATVELAEQLGYETPYAPLANWGVIDYLKAWEHAGISLRLYGQKLSLEQQRDAVISTFDTEISNYISRVKVYWQLDLSFLPTDLSQFSLAEKRNLSLELSKLKAQFRNTLISYNQNHSDKLWWMLNPDIELVEMSTEEKVGLLFGFSTASATLNSEDLALLKDYHVGNIIAFGQNVINPETLSSFTSQVQTTAVKFPVLISTDQEGGVVRRLWWENLPAAASLGSLSSQEQCSIWQQRAGILQVAGINWNLGTIADVTADPNSFIFPRVLATTFPAAAEIIANLSQCAVPVIDTLKHYPGHGATALDTHYQVATLTVGSEAEWLAGEALPFIAGINAGADSIMVGHLITSWLDPATPASISKLHHDYLRNQLGFEGLLVTDDLKMLETAGYDLTEVTKQALLAGNDILLYSIVDSRRGQLVQVARDLVTSSQLPAADLDARVIRILTALNKVIAGDPDAVPSDLVY